MDELPGLARPQFLDLVFQHQFSALQFSELEIVCGGMKLFRRDLFFECTVTPLEFREMVLHRHRANPFEIADVDRSLARNKRLARPKIGKAR
jgi:hypothetical protein